MKLVGYPISADPITFGHIDIIKRALELFGNLTIVIADNPNKRYTLNIDERVRITKNVCNSFNLDVNVVKCESLLVDFLYSNKIEVVIRGIRNSNDFDYENIIYHANQTQHLNIESVIILASKKYSYISSSVVKSLFNEGGDITELVPTLVKSFLEKKKFNYIIVGITGNIGSGKSTICKALCELDYKDFKFYNIDLDRLSYEILNQDVTPRSKFIKDNIKYMFGDHVLNSDGFIDRKYLGEVVFNNDVALKKLNQIMRVPILIKIKDEIRKISSVKDNSKTKIILLNGALIVESDMINICNNNAINILTPDKNELMNRLIDRGLNKSQAIRRLNCQFTDEKRSLLLKKIKNTDGGKILTVNGFDDLSKNIEIIIDFVKGLNSDVN